MDSMKIERDQNAGRNAFTGYGEGYVDVGGVRHAHSLVVGADRMMEWGPRSAGTLTRADFAPIVEMKPEILLLGTGDGLLFPDPASLADLHSARIGVEVMDTKAACRTYNILLGEGRNVVAALIL
jgi:uncharacterized protein